MKKAWIISLTLILVAAVFFTPMLLSFFVQKECEKKLGFPLQFERVESCFGRVSFIKPRWKAVSAERLDVQYGWNQLLSLTVVEGSVSGMPFRFAANEAGWRFEAKEGRLVLTHDRKGMIKNVPLAEVWPIAAVFIPEIAPFQCCGGIVDGDEGEVSIRQATWLHPQWSHPLEISQAHITRSTVQLEGVFGALSLKGGENHFSLGETTLDIEEDRFHFQGVTAAAYELFHPVVASIVPQLRDWRLLEGRGEVDLVIPSKGPWQATFTLLDAKAETAVWQTLLTLPRLEGSLKETAEGHLYFHNAEAKWALFPVVNKMEGRLSLRDGIIQLSTLDLELAGLVGTLECAGSLAKLTLSGDLPHFPDCQATLLLRQYRFLEGILTSGANTRLSFGTEIVPIPPSRISSKIVKAVQPWAPLIKLEEEPLPFRNGWFQVVDLPLHPFNIGGTLAGEGTWDAKGATLHYDVEGLTVDRGKLQLRAEGNQKGTHFIDWQTKAHVGSLSLSKATCQLEKFLLEDLKAEIALHETQVTLRHVEGCCGELLFGGRATIATGEDLNCEIFLTTLQGRLSQLQRLTGHSFPLEGQFVLGKAGASFRFALNHSSPMDMQLSGHFFDGRWEHAAFSLQGIGAEVSYRDKRLDVTDLQGTLLVGDKEEYLIASDQIQVRPDGATFDINVGDKREEIFRLVGDVTEESCAFTATFDLAKSHFRNTHPTKLAATFEDHLFRYQIETENFALTGTQNGDSFAIDRLQLDDLSLSADILKVGKNWQLRFLGLRYGKGLLAGLKGTFYPAQKRLDATIDLLEVGPWRAPQGSLTLQGSHLSGKMGDATFQADLKGNQESIGFSQFHFESDAFGIKFADAKLFRKGLFKAPKLQLRMTPQAAKLTLPTVAIDNLQATLEPLKITGQGELQFAFALQQDPVKGKALFLLDGDRLLLTELRDCVSQDRVFKFSLAKPSSIDWSGHMHVALRVKQQAALLKLAENRLLTLEGPWQSPTVTFTKP